MIIKQKQMKAELIEAADIIAEKERGEEEMGPVPMEEEQEPVYFNPLYSQVPPSVPTASKTIFDVVKEKMEPTIGFNYKLNEPSIPNLQQDVQYQSMPPQPPPNFDVRNNQAFEDTPPFNAVFQIKPKEPAVFSGKMEEDVVSWLNQVNSFFNMIPRISDIQKCCYVGSCLRGAAQDWWNYEGHTHQNNWNNF